MSTGWICPRCSAGCSPTLTQCPCNKTNFTLTTIPGVGTSYTIYCQCLYKQPGANGNCILCGMPVTSSISNTYYCTCDKNLVIAKDSFGKCTGCGGV